MKSYDYELIRNYMPKWIVKISFEDLKIKIISIKGNIYIYDNSDIGWVKSNEKEVLKLIDDSLYCEYDVTLHIKRQKISLNKNNYKKEINNVLAK